jgi:hypothetical protein
MELPCGAACVEAGVHAPDAGEGLVCLHMMYVFIVFTVAGFEPLAV